MTRETGLFHAMDLSLFKEDQHLVHGKISIANSLTPPAPWGTYSIRLPETTSQKLAKVKVILWSCMDRRVINPLYDQLITSGKYQPDEIFVVSMGGGPIQEGEERIEPLRTAFAELENKLLNLEEVWAVAHTGTCGGIKHFCHGIPLVEAVKEELKQKAGKSGIDPERYLTDLLLGNTRGLLPTSWQSKTELALAEPDEATRSVELYSHTGVEPRKLADMLKYE